MEGQVVINWILGLFGMIIGVMVRSVLQTVKDLQKTDKELADKVSRIEVLVAGEYVRKDELDADLARIFDKLDKIDSKLDNKADR